MLLKERQSSGLSSEGDGLRIAVIGGGCSGFQYKLGWSGAKEEDEIHQYDNGLEVFVDPKSSLYLLGAALEYHDSIEKTGFEVTNPKSKNTCGCGKSFS